MRGGGASSSSARRESQGGKPVLIGMIRPVSEGRMPWTLGGGQLRLQKTRMIATVRHAAAPTQNKKTARANRSSILLDGSAH